MKVDAFLALHCGVGGGANPDFGDIAFIDEIEAGGCK